MSKKVDFSGKPFHFIGIGGIGMSALAYVLAKRQLPVSGSDLRSTHITKRLHSVGAHIFNRQEANNLEFFQSAANLEQLCVNIPATVGIPQKSPSVATSALKSSNYWENSPSNYLPQVICSTAISSTNAEYLYAQELGCPIFHRSDLLAALSSDYQSIAVAGTHGKTTTSSLVGYLLLEAGLDPTVVIGGEVDAWEGNARLGNSPWFVAEADESDGSLIKLSAYLGIVTNIELDHPDHYQSLDEVIQTFHIFANQCQNLIGCIDCQTVEEELKPNITYSLNPDKQADYTVQDIMYQAGGTSATVWERGQVLGTLEIKLLGEHNLSNALAAVAVGRKLGLEFPVIAAALASFEGAKRRFEHRGESNGITFIDDYAHHPSEICATLSAAKLRAAPGQVNLPRRVVAIFQPHRYSRTLAFKDEFAQSFTDADIVVLTDIYSAGEPNLKQISGEELAQAVAAYHPQVHYQPSLKQLSSFLTEYLQPGDLALFLGAGNLNQLIPQLVADCALATKVKAQT